MATDDDGHVAQDSNDSVHDENDDVYMATDDDAHVAQNDVDSDEDDNGAQYNEDEGEEVDEDVDFEYGDEDWNGVSDNEDDGPAHADQQQAQPVPTEPLTRDEVYAWLEDSTLSPAQKLARRITYVLRVGLVACPDEVHTHWNEVHEAGCAFHFGLEKTYNTTPSRNTALARYDNPALAQLGLNCKLRPLGPGHLKLDRLELPSATTLQAQHSGWPEEGQYKGSQICLHNDDLPVQCLNRAVHDIDSFLHITHDPRDFHGPLTICLAPQPKSLLTRSVHLFLTIDDDEARQKLRVPIHRVPHIVLARRQTDTIYMFFPQMYKKGQKKTPYLTDNQHTMFFNVFLQPVFARLGPSFAQHVPDSFESVRAASRVAVEGTGVGTARGASIDVVFHQDNLRQLWQVMREAADRAALPHHPENIDFSAEQLAQLSQFAQPVFMYDSKNTKLLHQKAPNDLGEPSSSATDAIRRSRTSLGPCVLPFIGPQNPPLHDASWGPDVRRQYVDIGAEYVAEESGRTVLARRCCQYNTMLFLNGDTDKAFYGGASRAARPSSQAHGNAAGDEGVDLDDEFRVPDVADEDAAHRPLDDDQGPPRWTPPRIPLMVTTEYPVRLLRDSVSITCEPRKTSPLRALGVAYVQSYTIEEMRYNEFGVWAFSHPKLYNLGQSTDTWKTEAAKGKVSPDLTGAHKALLGSCKRLSSEFADAARAFGWRFEIRVTSALATSIIEAETAWATLVKGHGLPRFGYIDGQRDIALVPADFNVRPYRNAFYILDARRYNTFLSQTLDKYIRLLDYIVITYKNGLQTPQSAAALFALVVVALQQFICYRRDPVRYALMAAVPPAATQAIPADALPTARKVGLGVAQTIQARGFGFFPQSGINWEELTLEDDLNRQLIIPQLALQARWWVLQEVHGLQNVFQQALQIAVDPTISTAAYGDAVLSVLAQIVLDAFKASLYFAVTRKVATSEDMKKVSFTFTGLDALAYTENKRRCVLPVKNNHLIQSPAQYFKWAFTRLPQQRIKRDNIEKHEYFTMVSKFVDALDHMPHSRHVSTARFEVILYYRFCQQIGCIPSPDATNGVLSNTQKTGNRLVLCIALHQQRSEVPAAATIEDDIARIVRKDTGQTTPPLRSMYQTSDLVSKEFIRRAAGLEAEV